MLNAPAMAAKIATACVIAQATATVRADGGFQD